MKRTSLIKVIGVSVIFLSGVGASNQDSFSTTLPQVGTRDAMTSSKTSKLAQQLINREYGQFFIYPAHEKTIDAVWNTPGNPEALEALVNDKSAPTEARFLASEILFSRKFTVLLRMDKEELANIYAEALVNNYTGMANSWGFLYEFDDAGPVGGTFLVLGEAALPLLVRLLDNESISVTYIGSEAATIGNMYHFRVKDFAAFYISKITRIPIEFHREVDKRDSEIQKLKSLVNERFKNQ